MRQIIIIAFFFTVTLGLGSAFNLPKTPFITACQKPYAKTAPGFPLSQQQDAEDGVVELGETISKENEKKQEGITAPFLSQGEIADNVLNPDLSDPKQTRVIIYIILSLVPVLFLVPLILGSRDFIPADMLPPVEIQ